MDEHKGHRCCSDDEMMAFKIVTLYFEEIARLGFKRKLDLDAIMNAYFYSMARLRNKEKELEIMKKIVEQEEAVIAKETKEQLFPEVSNK